MTNFLHIKGHTYRVNRWKELVETWRVNGATIVVCGLNGIGKKTMEI